MQYVCRDLPGRASDCGICNANLGHGVPGSTLPSSLSKTQNEVDSCQQGVGSGETGAGAALQVAVHYLPILLPTVLTCMYTTLSTHTTEELGPLASRMACVRRLLDDFKILSRECSVVWAERLEVCALHSAAIISGLLPPCSTLAFQASILKQTTILAAMQTLCGSHRRMIVAMLYSPYSYQVQRNEVESMVGRLKGHLHCPQPAARSFDLGPRYPTGMNHDLINVPAIDREAEGQSCLITRTPSAL